MKKFIFSILTVSVFFLGIGAIVERTSATYKSDAKALELIAKARQAIGGDAAIASIQSMKITGRTTQTILINGNSRVETGETEIAMQLPDKFARTMKIGNGEANGHAIVNKQVDVVVLDGKSGPAKARVAMPEGGETKHRVVMKKDDGTVVELTGDEAINWIAANPHPEGAKMVRMHKADGEAANSGDVVVVRKSDGQGGGTFTTSDGKTIELKEKDFVFKHDGPGVAHASAARSNEMLKTTLSLLLTAPQGIDVSYTYVGEKTVDGSVVDVVAASFGGSTYKLFLDRASSLPVGIAYKGHPAVKVFTFDKAAVPGDVKKDNIMFTAKAAGPHEEVPVMVKFSDYRSVNGVQLPFRWATTTDGKADEVFDVTSYDINPADIAEKFKEQKVMVRMNKPDSK